MGGFYGCIAARQGLSMGKVEVDCRTLRFLELAYRRFDVILCQPDEELEAFLGLCD
jgi:hypothetical protein